MRRGPRVRRARRPASSGTPPSRHLPGCSSSRRSTVPRLIVLGSSSAGVFGHVVLGSVSDRLLHSSPCPGRSGPAGIPLRPRRQGDPGDASRMAGRAGRAAGGVGRGGGRRSRRLTAARVVRRLVQARLHHHPRHGLRGPRDPAVDRRDPREGRGDPGRRRAICNDHRRTSSSPSAAARAGGRRSTTSSGSRVTSSSSGRARAGPRRRCSSARTPPRSCGTRRSRWSSSRVAGKPGVAQSSRDLTGSVRRMATNDLLDLFPPGSTLDDGHARRRRLPRRRPRRRVRHAGAGRGRGRAPGARSRVRRRALGRAGRDSRVVFASKAFPCTAVQRVMVEEGLGLDVAGGGEILTALKAASTPASSCCTATPRPTRRSRLAVEQRRRPGRGRQRRRRRPAGGGRPDGASQDVLVRVIPGVTADTHQPRPDRSRGLQVRSVARATRSR